MATIRGKAAIQIDATQSASSPRKGGETGFVDFVQSITSGTGANQADLMSHSTFTVAASSNTDKDLTALTDPEGNALSGLAEVVVFYVKVSDNAAGAVNMGQSAANGWAALVGGTTDDIPLLDGEQFLKINLAAASMAVSGSSKSVNFANADASNTVTIEILVVGRSA